MPCHTQLRPNETTEQRSERARAATARLEAALTAGRANVVIDKRTGAISFKGWTETDRDGVADACAYRRLTAAGSSALRLAIARAEVQAGRKVNQQAIAEGVHSHDGGVTWGKD